MEQKYYKIVNRNGAACWGGTGCWHLPRFGKPGRWMPFIGHIWPCSSGYHLCRIEDIAYWIKENVAIYEVEVSTGSTITEQSDKVVVQHARLLRRIGVVTQDDVNKIDYINGGRRKQGLWLLKTLAARKR